jgi:hypothetical protein
MVGIKEEIMGTLHPNIMNMVVIVNIMEGILMKKIMMVIMENIINIAMDMDMNISTVIIRLIFVNKKINFENFLFI